MVRLRTRIRHTDFHSVNMRAFTLIEMLVVAGIVTVVSGIMLANYANFGGAITLRNLAYDVALSLREAQTFGISVRQFEGQFTSGYGMHIQRSSPTTYILFADAVTPNKRYDAGELVDSISIGRGFFISDLCVIPASASTETCGIDRIDVVFERPEPDARILYNETATAQSARIILESPRGDKAGVLVEASGQISVVNTASEQ